MIFSDGYCYGKIEIALGHSVGDGNLWKLTYEYGELPPIDGTVNTAKNTGNIARQTVSFNGLSQPFVQSYKYDSLYRLTEARETKGSYSNQTWKQTFGYDLYGNRNAFTQDIGGSQTSGTPAVDAATNRFTSTNFTYDKNGNITADIDPVTTSARQFKFNADNKQIEVNAGSTSIGRYYYDGEGRRVKKVTHPGATDEETTIFVYSNGKLAAEYTTATPPSNPTINYTATDLLGSPRVLTDKWGTVISRRDFMPFGEDLYVGIGGRTGDSGQNYTSSQDDVRQKYTGYEKDSETSLDFAEARMYENRYGRFTTVDPLISSGKPNNPQTYNRYVYCLNSPYRCTDPTGLDGGIWTYRNRDGGTEYKHFKSQEELDASNSIQGTEFCRNYPSACTPYKPWTGGDWILWDDRTGARLNSDGTTTPFSLQGYGTDEQWNQLVGDWYGGKGINEAWQKLFQVVIKTEEETRQFRQQLANDPILHALPMISGPLAVEAQFAQSNYFTSTSRGLSGVSGVTVEFRLQNRHFSGTRESARTLRQDGSAHIFNDTETYSMVESQLLQNSRFTTLTQAGSRNWARFGLRFNRPIGYRLGQDGSNTPLNYGEIKWDLNTNLYHIIPRTGPR